LCEVGSIGAVNLPAIGSPDLNDAGLTGLQFVLRPAIENNR
jgi:hypothetical protein